MATKKNARPDATVGTGHVFTRISQKMPIGIIGNLAKEARNWFRDTALQVSRANPNKILDEQKTVSRIDENYIGSMVCYFYDAKTKAKLPYWDRFPVIFPIEMYKDGFLGINLHYLPPIARAFLMDALYSTINTKTIVDERSKLRISYQILKSASKFKAFKPCIKRYLNSHVKSRFMFVEPNRWDIVLFLPLARFQKTSAEKVWQDSMNSIV